MIEKKPSLPKRHSNVNLITSQETELLDPDELVKTPRLMRKAQTRDGLVDIPSLLAEQGRKAVVLDKSNRNLSPRHYLSDITMNRRNILAI